MNAAISPEHTDMTILLPCAPSMGEEVRVPLYGTGTVCGLNSNYAGTGQAWLMLQWQDGKTAQFPYLVGEVR